MSTSQDPYATQHETAPQESFIRVSQFVIADVTSKIKEMLKGLGIDEVVALELQAVRCTHVK